MNVNTITYHLSSKTNEHARETHVSLAIANTSSVIFFLSNEAICIIRAKADEIFYCKFSLANDVFTDNISIIL